jgi:hypothetical protein
MRRWPALPRPGELVRLPLPCPPQLIELSGYTGGSRLIALWWSPLGDELMISDGTLTETGRWRGWLCFCQHPLARLFLEPYRLGDSDDEGEHRLLVDRYLGTLDVGLARDVEQLLALLGCRAAPERAYRFGRPGWGPVFLFQRRIEAGLGCSPRRSQARSPRRPSGR